jgi:hypothetical protein
MRVQFALDALCSTSAWVPPCGLGGDNVEQASKQVSNTHYHR